MVRVCLRRPNQPVRVHLGYGLHGVLSGNRMLAAHLRMDASNTMFAPGYLVLACYGNHGCTTSYCTCIDRSLCRRRGIERRHPMGRRQGIRQMLLGRGFSFSPIGFTS
jgi:hypothetical protein